MKKSIPSLVAVGVLVFSPCLRAAVEVEPAGQPDSGIKITRYVKPLFPMQLTNQGVASGEVRVALEVGPDGRLGDCLVTAYTHKEFADATVRAIQAWTFEPAIMNGKPASAVIETTIHFETSGVLLVAKFDGLGKNYSGELLYRPCEPGRLEHPPKALHVVEPYYPKQFYVAGATGTVRVEFYIDESGRVRMPVVRDATAGFLASVAVAAVREWRFEPPTSRGKPVLVRVSQRFTFAPESSG